MFKNYLLKLVIISRPPKKVTAIDSTSGFFPPLMGSKRNSSFQIHLNTHYKAETTAV